MNIGSFDDLVSDIKYRSTNENHFLLPQTHSNKKKVRYFLLHLTQAFLLSIGNIRYSLDDLVLSISGNLDGTYEGKIVDILSYSGVLELDCVIQLCATVSVSHITDGMNLSGSSVDLSFNAFSGVGG